MITLIRHPKNPLITKHGVFTWSKGSVLNPTVLFENNKFRMLYRATNDVFINKPGKYISSIGYAESSDGVNFEIRDNPVIFPEEDYEMNLGCEDPRLTKIKDTYYCFYTAVGFGPKEISKGRQIRIALATTKDPQLKSWTKRGIVGPKNSTSKAACLFPELINGKMVFLYTLASDNPKSTIMITEFESEDELLNTPPQKIFDFNEKGYEKNILLGPSTNSFRGPEVGAVPIKTDTGWLLIFCPENETKSPLWEIGAALLDLNNPKKVLSVLKEPILSPATVEETDGVVNNVTFPEGAVVKDGILYVYYGSGDQGICLATCRLKDLLKELTKNIK